MEPSYLLDKIQAISYDEGKLWPGLKMICNRATFGAGGEMGWIYTL